MEIKVLIMTRGRTRHIYVSIRFSTGEDGSLDDSLAAAV